MPHRVVDSFVTARHGLHVQVLEPSFLAPICQTSPPILVTVSGTDTKSASIITSYRRFCCHLLKTYRVRSNISLLIVIRPHAWKGDFGSEGWGFNPPLAHHCILREIRAESPKYQRLRAGLPGHFERVIPPLKLHRFLVSPAVLFQQEAGSMGCLDGAMLYARSWETS